MKTVEITLRITYNEKHQLHPRRWVWGEVCLLEKGEKIEVLPEPRQDDEIPQEEEVMTT